LLHGGHCSFFFLAEFARVADGLTAIFGAAVDTLITHFALKT
jgi:hypothetical protein